MHRRSVRTWTRCWRRRSPGLALPAFRFPRGTLPTTPADLVSEPAPVLGARWLRRPERADAAIVSLGPLGLAALEAAEGLELPTAVLDVRVLAPLDVARVHEACATGGRGDGGGGDGARWAGERGARAPGCARALSAREDARASRHAGAAWGRADAASGARTVTRGHRCRGPEPHGGEMTRWRESSLGRTGQGPRGRNLRARSGLLLKRAERAGRWSVMPGSVLASSGAPWQVVTAGHGTAVGWRSRGGTSTARSGTAARPGASSMRRLCRLRAVAWTEPPATKTAARCKKGVRACRLESARGRLDRGNVYSVGRSGFPESRLAQAVNATPGHTPGVVRARRDKES